MIQPLCVLRTVWYTLRTGVWLDGTYVSGHQYEEVNEGQCEHVMLLRCSVCGHCSIGWSSEPLR